MFSRKKRASQQAQQLPVEPVPQNASGSGSSAVQTQEVLEMMAAKSHSKHPHSKDDDQFQPVAEEEQEYEPSDDDDDLFKFSPPDTADAQEPGLRAPAEPGLQPPRTATARLKTAVSSVKRGMTGNSLVATMNGSGEAGSSEGRPVTSEARRIIKAYRKTNKQDGHDDSKREQPGSSSAATGSSSSVSGIQQRRQPYVYPGSPIYNVHPHSRSSESPTTSPTRDGTHTPVIELADRMRQASNMTMSYPPEYGNHPDDLRSVGSYGDLRGRGTPSLKKRSSQKQLGQAFQGESSAHLHSKGMHDGFEDVDMREVGGYGSQSRLQSAMSERIQTASYTHRGADDLDMTYVDAELGLDGDKLSYSAFELEEEEDSPFPEVRASVSNIDDPEMPCLTFRAWVLGLFLTALGGGVNLFFSVRYPAPLITPITVQVVSYPMGKFLAYVLPTRIFYPPRWAQRVLFFPSEFSMNPGPFNIKEHTVIVIMANISISPPYALNFTTALDKFYGIPKGIGFDFLAVLTTNVIGFSFAGICRRYLVWPASLVWPQNLVTCTLFNTFHAEDDDGSDGSLTRYRFFTVVLAGAFAWYFLPGFLFTALSSFSFVCWAAPRNRIVNQLFGVSSGLGMSVLTFDWSQIAYIGSPLIVPWWAEVNMFVGFLFLYWFLTPILYYTNVWNFAYMPISASGNFDRYGQFYNVSAVITPETTLDEEGYRAYSPLFMSTTYATVYGLSFTLASAAIVHTLLHNGKEIFVRFTKGQKKEEEDVHAKLMRNYPEVPDWWYWATFVVFASLAIVAIEVYKTGLPVWGLILALLVPAIYILPGGYIYALTAQLITINIISEMIPGYLLDGKPIANMLFKTFSVQCLQSGLYFVQDLKLGHYMKIPPRVTFGIQLIAACVAAASQVGVKKTLEALVPDLCTRDQHALLSCPTSAVTYEASIIWGVIGPKRFFGSESLYQPLLYFLLLGALLPIPLYLLGRKWPNSWMRYINVPVLLNGASYIPPATGINYSSWFIVGFIFQYWMRRHRFRWWSKFCFITSAALEGGTVISAVFIFFTLQLPKAGGLMPIWWGNEVYKRTADWLGIPYMLPPEEGFGPTTWS